MMVQRHSPPKGPKRSCQVVMFWCLRRVTRWSARKPRHSFFRFAMAVDVISQRYSKMRRNGMNAPHLRHWAPYTLQ